MPVLKFHEVSSNSFPFPFTIVVTRWQASHFSRCINNSPFLLPSKLCKLALGAGYVLSGINQNNLYQRAMKDCWNIKNIFELLIFSFFFTPLRKGPLLFFIYCFEDRRLALTGVIFSLVFKVWK